MPVNCAYLQLLQESITAKWIFFRFVDKVDLKNTPDKPDMPARRPLSTAHRALIRMIAERIVDRHIEKIPAGENLASTSCSDIVAT